MKIRFRVPEAGDPRRDSGVSLPPQESRRVPPRLRWWLITLLALSPAIWIALHFMRDWLWVESRGYVVFEELSLTAPADAEVISVSVVNGARVSRGAALVGLDNRELRAELDALRSLPATGTPAVPTSGQGNRQAELQSLQRRLDSLQARSTILRDLVARGAATRGELLAAEADEQAAAAAVASVRASMAQAPAATTEGAPDANRMAREAVLVARLRELELRAPTDGVVDNVMATTGQLVSRGDPLLVLRQGRPHVVAFMQGQDLRFAQAGESVSLVLPNRRRITGRVLGLAPSTRRLPEELAGTLDPRNPRLQVLIEPQGLPADAYIHRLPVSIRSFRFQWPQAAAMLDD